MYVIKIVTDKTLIKKRYPKRLPVPPSPIFIARLRNKNVLFASASAPSCARDQQIATSCDSTSRVTCVYLCYCYITYGRSGVSQLSGETREQASRDKINSTENQSSYVSDAVWKSTETPSVRFKFSMIDARVDRDAYGVRPITSRGTAGAPDEWQFIDNSARRVAASPNTRGAHVGASTLSSFFRNGRRLHACDWQLRDP